MKGKRFLLLISLGLVLMVSGCSEGLKKGKEALWSLISVSIDFDDYFPKRDAIVQKDLALDKQLEEEFYNEEDFDLALDSLQEVISTYEKLLKEAQAIEIKTDEIKEVHEVYVSSLVATIDSLRDYERGFLEENDEFFASGDEKMMEAARLADKSNEVIMELAEEYDIRLELE